MLGAPRDALLNTRFAQFVSPGETERWYLHFLRVLHHGERQRLELACWLFAYIRDLWMAVR